jgi:pantoate kinase
MAATPATKATRTEGAVAMPAEVGLGLGLGDVVSAAAAVVPAASVVGAAGEAAGDRTVERKCEHQSASLNRVFESTRCAICMPL